MSIDLEDFVADSLTQIVKGVRKAQKAIKDADELKGTDASISPYMLKTTDKAAVGEARMLGGQPVYNVEFDVAVTATETTSTSGGAGVSIGVVSIGGKGVAGDELGHVSRLTFRVPIVLPLEGGD